MLNGFTWNGALWNGSGAGQGTITPVDPGAPIGGGVLTAFEWDEGEGVLRFEPRLMSRAWEPVTRTIGGRSISGAGIPVSYLVRTDRLLSLVLRVWEDEWADALAFLRAAQEHRLLTWYPDATDPDDQGVLCYLASPALGESLQAQRLAEFPRVMEFGIMIRAASGTPWREFY